VNRISAWLCGLTLVMGRLDAAPGADVAAMVAQLADPAFTVREAAAKALGDLGLKRRGEVEAALMSAYLKSDDPEIRFRSREILTGLFSKSLGYLGIRYAKREHLDADGKRQWGVVINQVQPDSPAAKATLRAGDVILKLNQQPFGDAADLEFAKQVKAAGTGQTIQVEIERDGETLQVKVVLGTWPNPLNEAEAAELFESKLKKR
jgi:S1-C subfamily serine protease